MEITSINNLPDWLTLSQLMRINKTPKTFTVIANDKVYCTNNLARTLNTIATEYPNIKQTDITIIKKP